MNLKYILNTIYKANQCKDLEDVNFALKQIKIIIRKYPTYIAPQIRFESLTKLKKQFENEKLKRRNKRIY
jgi:hypothetical protein